MWFKKSSGTTAATRKSESVLQKRIRNFKKIKRAYYSLVVLGVLYFISFFNGLLINNQALMVKYNGQYFFPAASDWLEKISPKPRYYSANEFGEEGTNPPNYRKLKAKFAAEGKGNWVVMPLYPYGPLETPLDELTTNPPTPPDRQHILGTDSQGRDIFARVTYGFQISISFALLVTLLSYIMGILIGGALGYYGGRLDIIGLRLIEVFSLIPFLFMMIILVKFLEPSFMLLVMMLVVFGGWIGITYYVRGEFLREKNRDYVSAATAMGQNDFKIMFRHILPNAFTAVITFAPFAVIGNISALVALDFLGFGLPVPTPSWGELIQQGSTNIEKYWLILTPLVIIFLTLTTVTFIGEGVRQAFDPRDYQRLR
ncbi:peptide ABC transporter permease [Sphingobacteriales bacterium UPWRP_1]|nr:hypothetical protein B6N25_03295 [Sphingobacteriales bacterium TSM_CSS]PSJ75019.1 peptide ABC transporter permease [Sphingobacteriales bacterium UPWRP_1]